MRVAWWLMGKEHDLWAGSRRGAERKPERTSVSSAPFPQFLPPSYLSSWPNFPNQTVVSRRRPKQILSSPLDCFWSVVSKAQKTNRTPRSTQHFPLSSVIFYPKQHLSAHITEENLSVCVIVNPIELCLFLCACPSICRLYLGYLFG